MNQGALIQQQYYLGLGVAAMNMGTPHVQFRPSGATISDPLNAGNNIGTLSANMNIGGKYPGQTKIGQNYWQAIVDGTKLVEGDYLVGALTWCVVALDQLMPPIVLQCDNAVTVERVAQAFSATEGAHQGKTTILTNCPCSIALKRDKGFNKPVGFPAASNTDAPMPLYTIFIYTGNSPTAGVPIMSGDMLTDLAGKTYKVESEQWSPIGVELSASPYYPRS
jgi:hypothetical protein